MLINIGVLFVSEAPQQGRSRKYERGASTTPSTGGVSRLKRGTSTSSASVSASGICVFDNTVMYNDTLDLENV